MLPRVLFVDDDDMFLQMVARALRDDVEPIIVADPANAVELAIQSAPSLIVLDYRMPGIDGVDLLKELQKHEVLAAVPVWMVSGQEDEDLIAAVYDLGVADYLPKPVPMKMLRAKIARFLEHEARAAEIAASLARAERVVQDLHESSVSPALGTTHVPGLDLGALYRPLHQVGGDFFDIVRTRRDTYVIVIGDVCGHGIEAGLIQTMSRKLIQLSIRDSDSLSEALHVANAELISDLPDTSFVAAGFAEWTPATRELHIMRMGVPHPLWRDAEGRVELAMGGGTPLGIHKPSALNRFLTPLDITLNAGELVVLYTDGLVEAMMADESEYGFERARRALRDAPGPSAQEVAEQLLARADADGAQLSDDTTTIVLRCVDTEH